MFVTKQALNTMPCLVY